MKDAPPPFVIEKSNKTFSDVVEVPEQAKQRYRDIIDNRSINNYERENDPDSNEYWGL